MTPPVEANHDPIRTRANGEKPRRSPCAVRRLQPETADHPRYRRGPSTQRTEWRMPAPMKSAARRLQASALPGPRSRDTARLQWTRASATAPVPVPESRASPEERALAAAAAAKQLLPRLATSTVGPAGQFRGLGDRSQEGGGRNTLRHNNLQASTETAPRQGTQRFFAVLSRIPQRAAANASRSSVSALKAELLTARSWRTVAECHPADLGSHNGSHGTSAQRPVALGVQPDRTYALGSRRISSIGRGMRP